ncbi:MAG: hypothetical protein QOG53_2617 [Frankiales bacterium]|nr:hypothetical protein [Frankiales bacterium]
MRRTLIALVTTVTGLIFLLSFKSQGAGPTNRPAALAPTTPGPTSTAAPNASASPSRPSSAPQTATGAVIQTKYGPVQVRVTMTGNRLTDVEAIQLPTGDRRDIQISNYSVPQLRAEALAAQSAHINVISGATYTSDGYAQSLQSALDQLNA